MSKLFLFAIGGTGERVLRTTTMLLAAGIPSFKNYDIYPVIIDYDEENEDKKRTRDTLDAYRQIQRIAYANHPVTQQSADDNNKGQFFGSPVKELDGLNKFVLDFNPGTDNLKFRDKIDYDLMSQYQNTRALLESLYDVSHHMTTEMNLNLKEGFRGNPNIGSVIFHQIGKRDEFKAFEDNYKQNEGDKIVIIGSLFGGTGASGIPVLIQLIHDKFPTAEVAVLMIQPYFAPQMQDGGVINHNLFDSKTKSALNFYRISGLNSMVSAIYHIGDPYRTVVPYSEGGNTQKNNANPVEFIAALAIEHFVSGVYHNDDNNQEFMFGLNKSIVSSIGNDGKPVSCRLFTDDFDTHSKDLVLKYMDAFTICMKYVHEMVCTRKEKKEAPYISILGIADLKQEFSVPTGSNKLQDLLMRLDVFYGLYRDWLHEMDFPGDEKGHIQPNSHRLSFYDIEKDYPSLVIKETEKEENKQTGLFSIWGASKSEVSKKYAKLKSNTIEATMNSKLKDRKHLDEKGKALQTNEKEYVFMDILRASGIEIVNL